MWARWPGLNPNGLYLDDAWQSLLSRRSLAEQLQFRSSAPIGFTFVTGLVMRMVQDPELGPQLLPCVSGLLLIPLLAWFLFQLTRSPVAAVLAAALAAGSPMLLIFSVRVKQYTLDALAVTVLLLLALHVAKRPERLRGLALAAFVCLPFSFCSAVVATLGLNALVLDQLWRHRGWRGQRWLLVTWAGYHLAMASFYLLVLNAQGNLSLKLFWADYFPHSFAGLLSGFGQVFGEMLMPEAMGSDWRSAILFLSVLGAIVGAVNLSRHPQFRALGWAGALLYPVLGVMAMLHLYPLGGGRTDIFSYPVTIMLMTCGAHAVGSARWRCRRWLRLVGMAFIVILALLLSPRLRPKFLYPDEGDVRALVAHAEAEMQAGDALVIYPHGAFYFSSYTRWPTILEPSKIYATGFAPRVQREHVWELSGEGETYMWNPAVMDSQINRILDPRPSRILVHGEISPSGRYLHERLKAAGYQGHVRVLLPHMMLAVYTRSPPQLPPTAPPPTNDRPGP